MKKKTMDLTSGNVTKLLISYSLPLIATSLLQSVYSIVILVIILERFMGLNGVYLACMIAPSASVPIGMLYVKSGVWKRTYIEE